ncbi:MAG: branched-chain amino acid aminotransferase [Bacteroidota bacterium]
MDITDNISTKIAEDFNIDIQMISISRIGEIDFNDIPFGRIFSDHMFMVDYIDGKWSGAVVMPYGDLPMKPSISALHYGQAIFEGMKAYKSSENEVLLFRPLENARRFSNSAKRLCMPGVPEALFMEGLTTLLRIDSAWVPQVEGCSLYIRPVMFATTEQIKVKPADSYKFIILCCPVGPYYTEPVRVVIDVVHARASEGGVGFAKAAGNYAAALLPAKLAQDKGYHQLIWTDAKEHKYIEESGTMNIMFVIGDKLVTPYLDTGTILPGITRDSVLTIARDRGMIVEERALSIDEVIEALENGTLKEAFGAGTAATIAPVGVISYKGIDHSLPPVEDMEFANFILKTLRNIKTGEAEDTYNWVYKV